MPEPGDVILVRVKFTDSDESKIRPALILFEDFGNIIIAGITTNTRMSGISISKSEGAAQDSVIKLNYIFTITNAAVIKTVFRLTSEKRSLVFDEFMKKLSVLKSP
ncbi:MAG TPA: type II toxin-antitoxin system PemK/MazF family toxin [Thermoplasmataceae archaeon]|nr:type II toxin-antitoxin system PemK/MazF family toxin [Thermoplasmatales archaeon AK]HLH86537.1 type II toxin-antitoxin system PemK/MazF family toxin [Thermoplasmataceae archaeon]